MNTNKIKYNGNLVTVEIPETYDLKDFSNHNYLGVLFPIGKLIVCQKKPTMIGVWEKYKNKGIPLRLRKYYWIRVK